MTSIFTADSSTQLSGGSTNVKTYNTKDNPNMRLFSKSVLFVKNLNSLSALL